MHSRNPLHNTILPQKLYGIWNGHKKLDEIPAHTASEALKLARAKWGENAGAAILQTGTTGRAEPMFENEGWGYR